MPFPASPKTPFLLSSLHQSHSCSTLSTNFTPPLKEKNYFPRPPKRAPEKFKVSNGVLYFEFVQNYATLAAPLTNLLRSNQFSWPTEAATTFTTLQRRMAHLPTLALPNFDKPFV